MVAVPNVAGVPAVAFTPVVGLAATLLTGDDLGAFLGLFSPQWGIFDDGGNAVVVADTISDLGYKQEFTISDFPIEAGGFQSYDKVQTPFQARVRFVAGGNEAARVALLSSIQDIVGDLNFYDVVTPEATYQNANLTRYEYRRTAQEGVSLLMVDVTLEEVRIADNGLLSSTAAPSGADQTNGGTVQATSATGSGGIGSDTAASATAAANSTPVGAGDLTQSPLG